MPTRESPLPCLEQSNGAAAPRVPGLVPSASGSRQTCSECGGTNIFLDFERGEIKCHDCGLVIQDYIIDPGKDWQAFDRQEEVKKARCQVVSLPHNRQSTFTFASSCLRRDAKGNQLTASQRNLTARMRQTQIRSTFTDKDSLCREGLRVLSLMNTRLQLPESLMQSVSSILQRAITEHRFKLTVAPFLAACVYAMCKMNRTPRTFEELVALMPDGDAKQNRRRIWRFFRKLVNNNFLAGTSAPIVVTGDANDQNGDGTGNKGEALRLLLNGGKPQLYIPRFCSELGLSDKVAVAAINKVLTLISAETQLNSAGSNPNPVSVSAAAIYKLSHELRQPRSERQVKRVTGVSEVTIRKYMKSLFAAES